LTLKNCNLLINKIFYFFTTLIRGSEGIKGDNEGVGGIKGDIGRFRGIRWI